MFIIACGIARFDSIIALDCFDDLYISPIAWDDMSRKSLLEAIDDKMKALRAKTNKEKIKFKHIIDVR